MDHPKTREEFLKYAREIRLDPSTAHTQLLLSDADTKATLIQEVQSDANHPDRFVGCSQVLSRESLTGRCYWEVKCVGGGFCVSVSYKNIPRSGDECTFGNTDKSWALDFDEQNYTFLHNNDLTEVPGPASNTVGVYLDHDAGVLSFYSVSDTMTLLHQVQTTFSQPLYAGVSLYFPYGNNAQFIPLQ